MNKIFQYELRRLLWNKLFFGMLLLILGYGWLTLTGSVIRGVDHTAPFSPRSFGHYLSHTLPLVCLAETCFLAFFFSGEERMFRPLAQAAPFRWRGYWALRSAAALSAAALLYLSTVVLAMIFYVSLFGWLDYGDLGLPALLGLLPPLLLGPLAGPVLARVCSIPRSGTK